MTCGRFFFRILQRARPLLLSAVTAAALAQVQTPSAAKFRVAGIVISSGDGIPLSRARVYLVDVKNQQNQISIVTGDEGRFEFANVPAGKYSLRGAKRGYISGFYEQHEQFSTAIVTGAGLATENLKLRLIPATTLTGHVFDESGEAVRDAAVTLWRDDHSSGLGRTVRFRSEQTDDQGSFEFPPLDAGTYFLSVEGKPWYAVHPPAVHRSPADATGSFDRNLDVVYPVTYYSGATEVEDASPIVVRGGEHLDFDLHLAPLSALHVFVNVARPQPGQAFQIPVLQKHDFDGRRLGDQTPGDFSAPGVVEFSVAPGKYELMVPQNGGAPFRTSEVEISEDNQTLDTSSAQAVSSVVAKVERLGETGAAPPLVFALRDRENRVVARSGMNQAGEVSFANLFPGSYEVLAGSSSRAYSVVGMTEGGEKIRGRRFTLPAGTNLALTLSVAGGVTDVNGVAQRAGKGAAGAMIVLIPKNPETNRDLFRRDQSDLDGTFTFHSVIPGAYTVIAIENGWDLDWSKPAVIAHYGAHGQKLMVGGSQTIQLLSPVKIQPK
jgi:hypothetical protein